MRKNALGDKMWTSIESEWTSQTLKLDAFLSGSVRVHRESAADSSVIRRSPLTRPNRPPCNARVIAELRTQRTTLPHFLCRPTPSPHPSATATSRSCTARSDSSARSFSSSTSRLLPQQLPQATELSIPAERLGGGLKRQISCTSFCKGLHNPFVGCSCE